MMACFKVKRDEEIFIINGGIVLEELIALCNGRSNISIPHFSSNDLLRATNNYDPSQILFEDGGNKYGLYKGSLNDRPILVKKYKTYTSLRGLPCKDIAVGSQMSVHKNVLKVIGYCLETQHPTIVYEFTGTKSLFKCIYASNVEPLPWKCRLKIAADLANAIAYLHTAFARPLIHRDINSQTIILDENNVPKLIDFGLCIAIPKGQSHVENVIRGRLGYIPPECYTTRYLTEKADVYSFGVLLLELLSGQKPIFYLPKDDIWEWEFCTSICSEELSNVGVDPSITGEGIKMEQLLDFETLLYRCISEDKELRPTMIDVGKFIKTFYNLISSISI